MKEIRVAEIRAEAPAGAESLTLWGSLLYLITPTTIHDPAGTISKLFSVAHWTAQT